ncbi:MAG TPA: DUF559 domain-containing protein [Lysobacter sp.]
MREGQKRDFARRLRRDMTDAERHLWRHLRQRQLDGHRFRRQHPIGRFVADFVCLEQHLVIEVDGGQHADSTSDDRRSRFLAQEGFCVVRFWNHDVLGNIEGVVASILQSLASAGPHPNLPPHAGEGA